MQTKLKARSRTVTFWIGFCAAMHSASCNLCADESLTQANPTIAQLHAIPSETQTGRPLPPIDQESNAQTFRQLTLDLASARVKSRDLASYTAVLEIQEERDEQLKPVDQVLVKIRRQPFSVYMRWNDSGQEAIFVDGENNNRLLVKPTSALAALKRVWSLDPESRLAKQSCKYPITASGIEKLTERVQEFYSAHQDWPQVVHCTQCTSTVAGSTVRRYDVKFLDKAISPDFCQGGYCFDESSGLLIAVENFGWSDDQKERLVERYIYQKINPEADLLDLDFDQANPAYNFAVR